MLSEEYNNFPGTLFFSLFLFSLFPQQPLDKKYTFASCVAIFLNKQVPSGVLHTVGQLDASPPVADTGPLTSLPDDSLAPGVLGASCLALLQGQRPVVGIWREGLTTLALVAVSPSVLLPRS